MSSQAEIQKFMRDNEDFLGKILKETGKTNLSDYFLIYLREKEEAERLASLPKDLMLPPSLINDQQQIQIQSPAQNQNLADLLAHLQQLLNDPAL